MTMQINVKATLLILLIDLSIVITPTAQSLNSNQEVEKGQIVVVNGIVELKRRGESNPNGKSSYSRVSIGTPFSRGDLLKVEPSATATVLCAGGSKHELKSGVHGLPCKATGNSRTLNIDGFTVIVRPTRSGETNPNVPIILSPRRTKLLNPRPALRWIPGARPANYIVNVYEANPDGSKLEGSKFDWSLNSKLKNQCPYPNDPDKQLTPGATYMLTVKAGSYSSDEESIPRLVFTLLSTQEAQVVRDLHQRIADLGLPKIAADLLTAQLFAKFGLNAEAIELLQELSAEVNEPVIAQLLGDLYATIHLNQLAMESYLKALNSAEDKQDKLSVVRAQTSLGQISEALGKKAQAIEYWRRAKENCQLLEETEMVQEIDKTLKRLQEQ